jgi:hypothetical protein
VQEEQTQFGSTIMEEEAAASATKNFSCELCGFHLCGFPSIGSEIAMNAHLAGKKHMRKAARAAKAKSCAANLEAAGIICYICGIPISSEKIHESHLSGQKHFRKIEELKWFSNDKQELKDKFPMLSCHGISCDDCGLIFSSENALQTHLVSKSHLSRTEYIQFTSTIAGESQTSSNDKKQNKGEVEIAVEDSAADIITFKESVGGKSAQKGDFDLNTSFEGISIGETSADEVAKSLFLPKRASNDIQKHKGLSLFSSSTLDKHSEGALFGHLFPSPPSDKGLFGNLLPSSPSEATGDAVYFNTHEPFCFITVGVQGAGKSHTSLCVLESCLVPFKPGDIVKLTSPMTSMVLHYDQNKSSICEAAGLLSPNASIKTKK